MTFYIDLETHYVYRKSPVAASLAGLERFPNALTTVGEIQYEESNGDGRGQRSRANHTLSVFK